MVHEEKANEDEALTDVEVPLIAMDESILNKTFEIDESEQNALNETFELETSKGINDKPEDNSSRFVEFSAHKEKTAESKSSQKPALKGGKVGSVSTPVSQESYLSKKNKTPLRGVAMTPSSIAKR